MKSPRGFGKTYFTLSSILAHSVESVMQSQICSFKSILHRRISKEEEVKENDPPDDVELFVFRNVSKPSHCNCFFKAKARLMLQLHHYIPRCPFYTPCFAFRRTGVHPPLSFFNH